MTRGCPRTGVIAGAGCDAAPQPAGRIKGWVEAGMNMHANSVVGSGDGGPFDSQSANLIFGKYEVIRRLALGGMGEVFLARQTGVAVDRLVILKSLLPELAEQEGFVDQFLDEARVAATLNHPNIVGIYEVGLWNGIYFIAMEFIHGGDLAKLQRTAARQGLAVPFQVSARMVHDAALGLDHAHHAVSMDGTPLNIVHRDISPQNIMVRGDGVTKVVDFGIAKAANRSTRTATGMLKGKLQYMAPEQIRGDNIDGRADQFALGAVLWEMTTNQRLFKGDNELKTLEKILKEPVPVPSQVVPGFPPLLEQVVMRMLQRDPADRYPRLADAANDLRGYLDTCSRAVGQTQVADFVRTVLGAQLDEVTKDLTPSKDNFIINLESSGPQEPGATPTTMTTMVELKQRRRLGLAAGLVGVLALLVVSFVALSGGKDEAIPDLRAPGDGVEDSTPPTAQADEDDAEQPKVAAKPKIKLRKKKSSKKHKGTSTDIQIDEPVGAKVVVDGKTWPDKVPTIIKGLAPGAHKIEVETPDGKVATEEVRIEKVKPRLRIADAPDGCRLESVSGPNHPWIALASRELDFLDPGTHKIKLVANGYRSKTISVTLDWGDRKTESADMHRRSTASSRKTKPARDSSRVVVKEKEVIKYVDREKIVEKKAKEPGFLTVRTDPWAKIFIDGQPKGSTPLFKLKLSAGRHKVRLVNEAAGIDSTKTVKIESTKNLKKVWKLE